MSRQSFPTAQAVIFAFFVNSIMDRVKLISDIEAAFKGVSLDGGIGIYEAEVIDDYGDEEERNKAKIKDSTSWVKWEEIPKEILKRYYTTFCFVDSKGFKFLIPAYMRFTLKYCEIDDSASIDATIYALQPSNYNFDGFAQLLNKKQKKVISRFLEYLILEVGENWVDTDVALLAYEAYWYRYN
ncbi:MAG: DUF6714 family protein [Cyanobacteria bacterium P01_G01_bin.49]